MHEFQIREYRESDISGIITLFRLSFHKEASEQWFRWKYQYSPFGSKGYVAIDGGMVVAFYGGIRLQFSFNDRRLWAYQFCDVMTHPQYRGRFISKRPLIVKLGEMFYRENPMDFAFGFPSLRHARLQSLRLGGEDYKFIRLYKKEQLKRRIMSWKLRVKEGWGFFKEEEIDKFYNIKGCENPSPLAGEGKGEGDVILKLVKNEEYIRWRYIENPLKEYGLFIFKRMKRTKGYIVLTIEDDWVKVLEIFCEKDKDVKDILISLEAYIVKNMPPVRGISLWVHPCEPVIRHLDHLRYAREDSIPIAFKSVNTACGVTSEIFYERYFYRMGDYDAS